ncbi:hypothetical protein [Yinghuangia seranimata]|uniref:hypothetical protein n=1 Tax=Yinghuangia seranimata TaxID=408067 RepID=UPI00248C521E|nr:hypothetical protein [Yinghuangia seranimata]MDI2130254.1 hypothetical protein [Yinghuangia seranimata]
MSTLLIVIGIAAAVLLAGAVAGRPYLRRQHLRRRFGPEYDRALGQFASRRDAERNLVERERRFRDLDIRPLPAEAKTKYEADWNTLMERFVEAPADAVTAADELIARVMHARGYPTGAADKPMEVLSVSHGHALDRYRQAQEIGRLSGAGKASTEDLRQALLHHRTLFLALLGRAPDAASPARETSRES